jgi:uncharacterized protein (DUF849 family)
MAPSSAAQVSKAREIIEGVGRRLATPDEARARLALKGGDKTAF